MYSKLKVYFTQAIQPFLSSILKALPILQLVIDKINKIAGPVVYKFSKAFEKEFYGSYDSLYVSHFYDAWFRKACIWTRLKYENVRDNLYVKITYSKFISFFFTEEELNEMDKNITSVYDGVYYINERGVKTFNKELFEANVFWKMKSFFVKTFSVFVTFLLTVLAIIFMTPASKSNISSYDFYARANYEITAGTEMIKSILTLYSNMVVILFVIGILVASILLDSIMFYQDTNVSSKRSFVVHNQPLEFIWTTIPAIIVTLIAIPTLMWIYLSDRDLDPTITVSVTGHQWYWNYKIMTNEIMTGDTDSFMLPTEIDIDGIETYSDDPSYRYLMLDNYLVVPSVQKLRFTFSSNDVIHSWAVPALGIKVDAVPGRATRLDISINQEGLFYGQCSELCGVNHAFMPIGVDVVGAKHFLAHTRQ